MAGLIMAVELGVTRLMLRVVHAGIIPTPVADSGGNGLGFDPATQPQHVAEIALGVVAAIGVIYCLAHGVSGAIHMQKDGAGGLKKVLMGVAGAVLCLAVAGGSAVTYLMKA